MMNRPAVIAACVLVCLLIAGCGQLKSSNNSGVLSKTHEQAAPAEAPAPHVCVLDPAAQAPSIADVPKTSPATSPVAEVPETVFDFGKMTGDNEFVHKFSVRNVGRSVLNIKKVVPG